jgi:ankyrin repeat protein
MSDQTPARYLPIPCDYSDDEYLKTVLVNALDAMAIGINPKDFTVHTQNSMGDTPLQYAVAWGDIRAVRLLVEAGAEIDTIGEMDCTPLYHAVLFGWCDIAEYLIQRGANLEIKSEFGDTPRELAQSKGFKIRVLEA